MSNATVKRTRVLRHTRDIRGGEVGLTLCKWSSQSLPPLMELVDPNWATKKDQPIGQHIRSSWAIAVIVYSHFNSRTSSALHG